MPDCARKECSNQKVDENSSDLGFKFTMKFKCPERILNNFESQRALTGMPIISAPGLSSADVWLFLI